MDLATPRKRRFAVAMAVIAAFSFGVSSVSGLSFLEVFKPIGTLFIIGLFLGWVAYEVAEFNPYRY